MLKFVIPDRICYTNAPSTKTALAKGEGVRPALPGPAGDPRAQVINQLSAKLIDVMIVVAVYMVASPVGLETLGLT